MGEKQEGSDQDTGTPGTAVTSGSDTAIVPPCKKAPARKRLLAREKRHPARARTRHGAVKRGRTGGKHARTGPRGRSQKAAAAGFPESGIPWPAGAAGQFPPKQDVQISPQQEACNRAAADAIRDNVRACQTRILLFRGGIALAIIVLVCAAILDMRADALQRARTDAASLAATYEQRIQHILEDAAGSMSLIERRFALEGRGFDLGAWIKQIPELTGAATQIAILGVDGKLVATTLDRSPAPVDFSGQEFFKIHVDNPSHGLFISKPVFGRISRQVTLQLTKRLHTREGHFAGVLMLSLAPEVLTTLHRSVDFGASGAVTLVGTDSVIRARFTAAHGQDVSKIGGLFSSGIFLEASKNTPAGNFERASLLDGVERLYSWRRVEGFPLIVVAGLARAEVLATANRNALFIGGLGAAAVLILILSGAALYRNLEHHADSEIALNLESAKLKCANENLTRQYDAMMTAGAQLAEERIKQERINAELVMAKQKAEELSRTKSAFLANMSHELRTPLNAIIGFSEIIRDRMFGADMRRYADYANDIHKAGSHLLSIINDVLDVARIEAGKVDLNEEVVSPGDVIEASLLAVRIQALKGEVALNVELPDGLPKVRVDEMRLRQIMINLLSNAVKFTPAGGEVTISAALVRGGGLELCVADTGIGMSEDEVRTAMEIFSQVDTRLARHFEGTGLGLPLAKQLTELHGGRLTVESVPEAGTEGARLAAAGAGGQREAGLDAAVWRGAAGLRRTGLGTGHLRRLFKAGGAGASPASRHAGATAPGCSKRPSARTRF